MRYLLGWIDATKGAVEDLLLWFDHFFWNPIDCLTGNVSLSFHRYLVQKEKRREDFGEDYHAFYSFW